MKFFIITIIAIILIFYISTCDLCNKETFTSNILFGNLPSIIMKSDTIKKITQQNPGKSEFVLEQFKFDTIGYKISFTVKPRKKYLVSYWRTNDQSYDGSNYDMKVIANNICLTKKGKIVNYLEKDNFAWKQINYIINTGNFSKIVVELGTVGIFTKGKRYFSDLQIEEIVPEIKNFKYKKNLNLFIKFNSAKIQNKQIFKDVVSDRSVEFNNKVYSNSYGINLNKSIGTLGSATSILDVNYSVFFVYTAEENQNGSLLHIPATNEYNSGINIDMQSNIGSDNRLSLTIVEKNYIYDIGLIQNPITFALIIKGKEQQLFINGKLVKPIITNISEDIKELGTCPDSWMYMGNNKCKRMSSNIGMCNSEILLSEIKDKTKWTNKCKTSWTNCKKLNIGEIAPSNKSSCVVDNNLNYSNKPVLLNKDAALTGRLHSLIIYNGILDAKTTNNIYNYLARELLNLDAKDSVCDRPSLYKSSQSYIIPATNEFESGKSCCPFTNKEICADASCKNINWKESKSFSNITTQCKTTVNDYCKNNYDDQYCNLLRNNKLNNAASLKMVEEYKKKGEIPDKDCTNCDSKIDLSKYIKKDKVPCWGCNIDNIKNL